MSDKTRTRRDHMKYLTLIQSIALLHQYQREVKRVEHRGQVVEYIEVTRDDIALANRLAHEILGRTLDEMPPQTRKLLLLIQTMVNETAAAHNCKPGEVRFTRGVVNVRQGKGKKDRVVPVGHVALEWVMRYLRNVRPRLAQRFDSGHLFITWHGKGLNRGTLTQLAGEAIRDKARIDKPGACHIFRHSMATQMLDNGADTRHIQAILGHEKLETTQIYTKVAIAPLQRVHEKTHPAEKRRRKSVK